MTARLLRPLSGLLLLLGVCGFAPTLSAQNVTLTDNGTTVTLANGLVAATITKSDGTITNFSLGSSGNMASSDGFYFSTHVTTATRDVWAFLSGVTGATSTYSVTINTTGLIDISIRNPKLGYDASTAPNGLFDVDKHYVMRSGVAGIYTYIVWNHTASQPAAGLYQQRTQQIKVALPGTTTSYSYSDATTWNLTPGADVWSTGTLITDSTYELPATTSYTYPTGATYETNWPIYYSPNPDQMIGLNYNLNPVWTKYDWAVYSGPETSSLNTFGVANDQYGLWVLNGSQEYLNGGPTKLRGAVQASAMAINANENHGSGEGPDQSLADGQVWQKIYGPYMIYANAGTSHTALWTDAQAKGAAEVTAWPPTWMPATVSESLFPRTRGTITGKLTIPGQSTANAQIVVANNSTLPWMFQGAMNYIYSTQADAYGNFTVPKLRPDTYSVFAYVPGVLGDYQLNNVAVAAGATTALGTLTWNPPQQQQLLFRVGTPDRSSGEFRFGDMSRQFGLWFRYYDERAGSALTYTVGTSTPANDWYWAQPVVAGADGLYHSYAHNINFNLPTVPPSPCTLTVALSGSAGSGAFHVYVNGTDISPDTYHGIYAADDAALYRDAVLRGQYQTFPLTFSASLLHAGQNTVTITVRKTGSGTYTGGRPVIPAYGLMYDCIQLEAGAQTVNTLLSQAKPSTASAYEGANTVAKGNDGSAANRWNAATTATFPQWWRVDLGAAHTVRSMIINWYQNATKSYKYKIEASNDDVSYTTVVDKTANTDTGVSFDTIPSTTAYRYIRVTVTGSNGGTASFYEAQVFGD